MSGADFLPCCFSVLPLSRCVVFALFVLSLCSSYVAAETGREAWLRYARISPASANQFKHDRFEIVGGEDPAISPARAELARGLKGML